MITKPILRSALVLGAWLTLTQPAAAQFTFLNIGHTNDSDTGVNIGADAVAVSGNVACLAMYNGGLYVYDVSDPANPVNVARTNDGGYTRAVAMAGHYAYACAGTGLRIYDLSDAAHPVCLAQTNQTFSDAYRVYVAGDYAYTAGEYEGVRLYNVSDPAHPLYLSHISGPRVYDAVIRDNYAYLVGSFDSARSSLRIYDLSNPASPVLIGQDTNQLNPGAIALSGNYALIPSYLTPGGGLWVCDISDPHNPFVVAHSTNAVVAGSQNSVVVSGNYAYTSEPFPQMFDLSDPLGLSRVGQLPSVPYRHRDIAVVGNYLYAATGGDGLRTYLLFPELAASTTANTVALSWPLPPAPGFRLQSNPTLASGTWSEVTNAPVLTSNRNLVVLPAPATSQFYRLKYF